MMIKLLRTIIVLTVGVIYFNSCLISEEKKDQKAAEKEYQKALTAYEKIENHMEEKYGEEFVLYRHSYGRRRDDTIYEATAYPKRYEGTPKAEDKYYHVDILTSDKVSVIEHYGSVKLKEGLNELYLPKLQELFGKNVVVAITTGSNQELESYLNSDDAPFVGGAIYIYGRVDNDEDREEYREKIWKFVQYMKETGTYGYVDLGMIVVDERILTDEFNENEELKDDLVRARFVTDSDYILIDHDDYEERPDEEYRKRRRELMNSITEKVDRTKLHKRLVDVNITDTYKQKGGNYKASYYNTLLNTKIMSSKQWDKIDGSVMTGRSDYEEVKNVEFYKEYY